MFVTGVGKGPQNQRCIEYRQLKLKKVESKLYDLKLNDFYELV